MVPSVFCDLAILNSLDLWINSSYKQWEYRYEKITGKIPLNKQTS